MASDAPSPVLGPRGGVLPAAAFPQSVANNKQLNNDQHAQNESFKKQLISQVTARNIPAPNRRLEHRAGAHSDCLKPYKQNENTPPGGAKVVPSKAVFDPYSPFTNPLGVRPETRTSAGFIARYAMQDGKRMELRPNQSSLKEESVPLGEQTPVSKSGGSFIESSWTEEDDATPGSPVSSMLRSFVDSNDSSWLSGSCVKPSRSGLRPGCDRSDASGGKSAVSAGFTFWPHSDNKATACSPSDSSGTTVSSVGGRSNLMTPNTAREQLTSRIPRKSANVTRIPTKPSKLRAPIQRRHSHGDLTLGVPNADTDSPDGENDSSDGGGADSYHCEALGSAPVPLVSLSCSFDSRAGRRRKSTGTVMSSEIGAASNQAAPVTVESVPQSGHDLLEKAASSYYRQAAIRATSAVRRPTSTKANGSSGTNAPPTTPLLQPVSPLIGQLRRTYGVFGGVQSSPAAGSPEGTRCAAKTSSTPGKGKAHKASKPYGSKTVSLLLRIVALAVAGLLVLNLPPAPYGSLSPDSSARSAHQMMSIRSWEDLQGTLLKHASSVASSSGLADLASPHPKLPPIYVSLVGAVKECYTARAAAFVEAWNFALESWKRHRGATDEAEASEDATSSFESSVEPLPDVLDFNLEEHVLVVDDVEGSGSIRPEHAETESSTELNTATELDPEGEESPSAEPELLEKTSWEFDTAEPAEPVKEEREGVEEVANAVDDSLTEPLFVAEDDVEKVGSGTEANLEPVLVAEDDVEEVSDATGAVPPRAVFNAVEVVEEVGSVRDELAESVLVDEIDAEEVTNATGAVPSEPVYKVTEVVEEVGSGRGESTLVADGDCDVQVSSTNTETPVSFDSSSNGIETLSPSTLSLQPNATHKAAAASLTTTPDSSGPVVRATRALLTTAEAAAADVSINLTRILEGQWTWAAGAPFFFPIVAAAALVWAATKFAVSSVGCAVQEGASPVHVAHRNARDFDSPDSDSTPLAAPSPSPVTGGSRRERSDSACKLFLEALATPLAVLSPLNRQQSEEALAVEEAAVADGDGAGIGLEQPSASHPDDNSGTPSEPEHDEGNASLGAFQTPKPGNPPSSRRASVSSVATSRASTRRRRASEVLPTPSRRSARLASKANS